MMNQCDGCQRGLPIIKGKHYLIGIGSYPGEVQACTRYLYKSETTAACLMDESLDEELGGL